MSLLQLSLRMMLWILFLAAVITGWGWERWGYLKPIAEAEKKAQFSIRMGLPGTESAIERRTKLEAFAKQSEEEFRKQIPADLHRGWGGSHELWLTEMTRRRMIDELRERLAAATKDTESNDGDVPLLTALRRAEGKPDPVAIEVAFVERDHEDKPLPSLHVQGEVRNCDVERRPWSIHLGGDYRGGRLERWQLTLTDEQGRRVEPSNFASFIGGGLGVTKTLEFGQTADWQFVMDPRRYARPPSTGRYQLQLAYSDAGIADEWDTTGLIVWQSKPIWVEVVNRDEVTFDSTLIRLTVTIALALLALFVCYLFTPLRTDEERRQIPWVDVAFCCVVISLAIGWWCDCRQLRDHLARLQPDADASWTIVKPAAAGERSR